MKSARPFSIICCRSERVEQKPFTSSRLPTQTGSRERFEERIFSMLTSGESSRSIQSMSALGVISEAT